MKSLKQKLTLIAFFCFILLLQAYPVFGQATSGMQFLEIGPNTPALGFAGAHTAASIGPSNLYSNPANMAFEKRSSLGADYTLWLVNTNISHVAGSFDRGNHTFGAGIISNKIPDIPVRKNPGPSEGDFSVSYLSVAGAYAQKLNSHIALGVTGQFLNEQYWVHQASGYAFNIGVTSRWLNRRIKVAAVVRNLGRMNELARSSTPLPTNARFGVATNLIEFTTPGDNDLPILVKLYTDLIHPIEKEGEEDLSTISTYPDQAYFNFGTEISVGDIAILRSGYQTENTRDFRQDVRGISFGAGFWIENFLFNYSVTPFKSGYKTAHSIGLQYYFD